MSGWSDIALRVAQSNPDVTIVGDGNVTDVTPGGLIVLRGATHQVERSALADKFEYLWCLLNGPSLVKEYRFHVARRWKFDYYHEPTMTAIELEGGLYSGGRHSRAEGYLSDIEKYNAASMQGIVILRLGTGQVDAAHIAEFVSYLERRAA
jgi:hypothetical protein